MKAELKTLSKEHADVVAAHLLAAASLVDEDPDLAFRHAEAAKRRAARLPVVREAVAETAYAAGRFDDALSEFRALRRMNGSPDYLPVLADCERALGRHQAALRLVTEGESSIKDPSLLVELRLVQAGVRADMGQRDEALRLLRTELEAPRVVAPKDAQARLRYAYADLLFAGGDEAGARKWFSAAVRLDPEGQTDALDRLDELDGMILTLDEDDLDDDEDRTQSEAAEAEGAPEQAKGHGAEDAAGETTEPEPTPDRDLDVADQIPAASEADEPAEADPIILDDPEELEVVEKPKRVRKAKPADAPADSEVPAESSVTEAESVEKPKRVRKTKAADAPAEALAEADAGAAESAQPDQSLPETEPIEKSKRVRKAKAVAEGDVPAPESDAAPAAVEKPKRVRKAKPAE